MAEETWVDRVLDRAKDIPVIGRAAEWAANWRETTRQDDAFSMSADRGHSTHTRDEQLREWRNALGPTAKEWDRYEQNERSEFEAQERSRNTSVDGASVKEIRSDKWQINIDGTAETRTAIGQSDKGYHFKNEWAATNSDEVYGQWSKAFKTQDLAERVGSAVHKLDDGQIWHLSAHRIAGIEAQERPRTMRGEIAYTLRSAAEARSWTKSSWSQTPESQAEIVTIAKKHVAHARELNNISRVAPTQSVQRHQDMGISR